ncbi:Uncharacterised protein [Mycobacterium tuberculosis]|nr:Uncharacterised protein [Mycobacterium tuberculosis]
MPGKTHRNRATMTIAETIATAVRISIGSAFDFSIRSRSWNPIIRNSTPSISQITKSQKKMPCNLVFDEISSGPFQLT